MPDVPIRLPLVAVCGDGDARPGSPRWALAAELGRRLVDARHRVLTGGLGGVMAAAAQGARESRHYRSGDTIGVIPADNHSTANPYIDIVIPTGLGSVRNTVVARADALIVVAGGAGTLSEIAYAWMYGRLIVAMRGEGWAGRLADEPVDHRRRFTEIPDDRVRGASTATEAVELVLKYRPIYSRATLTTKVL